MTGFYPDNKGDLDVFGAKNQPPISDRPTFLVDGHPAYVKKFLGHQNINMTLIYAKVFDETVRRQFAAAMAQIEGIAVANWPMQFNPSSENLSISTPEICDSV